MTHSDREFYSNGEREGTQVVYDKYEGGVVVGNYVDGSFVISFKKSVHDYDREKPKNIGTGDYGDVYSMPKNDIRGAVSFLAEKKGGEIRGFYKNDDLGVIDLVWGNLKGGLQHMIDKHVGYNGDKMKDFATVEELADEIQFVLDNGEWKDKGDGRYEISVGKNSVIVCENYSGKDKTWIITAFDANRSKKEKGITDNYKGKDNKRNGTATNHTSTSHGDYGSEYPVDTRSSEGKDTQNSDTGSGNNVKSSKKLFRIDDENSEEDVKNTRKKDSAPRQNCLETSSALQGLRSQNHYYRQRQ